MPERPIHGKSMANPTAYTIVETRNDGDA